MSKITKATKKNPIEVEITVRQGKKVNTKKFKIYGMVNAYNRAGELETIPQTPHGDNDNWLISKMICEKDGGRLPSLSELAIIEGLQEENLINTKYYGNFWSSSESSASSALRRYVGSYFSYWYQSHRGSQYEPLCLGD